MEEKQGLMSDRCTDPAGSDSRKSVSAPGYREGIDAGLTVAVEVCREQAALFLSPQYASPQPSGSITERFAISEVEKALQALMAGGGAKQASTSTLTGVLSEQNPSPGGASVGLVEAAKVAHAIFQHGWFCGRERGAKGTDEQAEADWQVHREAYTAAVAALSTPLPEGGDAGWRWVPIVPTAEMRSLAAVTIAGGWTADQDRNNQLVRLFRDDVEAVWSAMLSSAPSIDSGFRPSQTDGLCGLQTAAWLPDRTALKAIVRRELTDDIKDTANARDMGKPDVLVAGCQAVGYQDPEDAADGFANFIADAFLALLTDDGAPLRRDGTSPKAQHEPKSLSNPLDQVSPSLKEYISRRCLICANINPCREHSAADQAAELARNDAQIAALKEKDRG